MNAQVNYHKIEKNVIEIHYFYDNLGGVFEAIIPIEEFEMWIKEYLPDVYDSCKVSQIVDMTNSDPEFNDARIELVFEMELFEEYHMSELVVKEFINHYLTKQQNYVPGSTKKRTKPSADNGV